MDVMRIIGSRVRKRRQELGISQATLAGRAQVSRRLLIQLEAGQGNPTIRRLIDVCTELKLSLEDVFRAADKPQSSVALVGLRGAGKSTVGRALAEHLGINFVELDELVERDAQMSLAEIFEFRGPHFYREAEARALERALATNVAQVIAVGGSLVTSASSWRNLRKATLSIWLRASPRSHFERVTAQGDLRPMVGSPNALAEIEAILEQRSPHYSLADLSLDTDSRSIRELVEVIASARRPEPSET